MWHVFVYQIESIYIILTSNNFGLTGLHWQSTLQNPVVILGTTSFNNLPPTSAEVKKMWIYTSTPLYVFMA
jgi:hypothetical protein